MYLSLCVEKAEKGKTYLRWKTCGPIEILGGRGDDTVRRRRGVDATNKAASVERCVRTQVPDERRTDLTGCIREDNETQERVRKAG